MWLFVLLGSLIEMWMFERPSELWKKWSEVLPWAAFRVQLIDAIERKGGVVLVKVHQKRDLACGDLAVLSLYTTIHCPMTTILRIKLPRTKANSYPMLSKNPCDRIHQLDHSGVFDQHDHHEPRLAALRRVDQSSTNTKEDSDTRYPCLFSQSEVYLKRYLKRAELSVRNSSTLSIACEDLAFSA